jgi:perosamine synthetase
VITHSKVVLEEEDLVSVSEVLRSGQLAQGKVVSSFENRVANSIGVRHGAAVSSGTAALHLSLISLGVSQGSQVILPSYVCTALLNAIHYVGATPAVVDIDPGSFNISVEDTKKALSDSTVAIMVPHMFGLPADMDEILSLGVPVIEDCAQAVGATYKGKIVGSLGHASVFSFYATKLICAGEGGLVLSDRAEFIERIRDLRDYDEKETYRLRYNYKLTDIHAALGLSQFKKLPSLIRKRKEIARIYDDGLGGVIKRTPFVPHGREHIYYRYVVLVENVDKFIEDMRQKGIECRRPVFKPLHRYLNLPGCPVTDDVWSKAVSIPIYPSLSREEVYRIVDTVNQIIQAL